MEEKEGLNDSGFTVKGDVAPESYRVESRVESSNPAVGSTAAATPVSAAAAPSTEGRKKRGRPRKYAAADGSISTLSPMPISASIPFTGDYSSTWKNSSEKPSNSSKKKHKLDFSSPGMIFGNLMC